MIWDEWRGSFDGRPSMWIKTLLQFRGYKVELHKFVRADDPDCFHTHPATAIRIVLWGGYIEQIHDGHCGALGWRPTEMWWPGCIGIVRPALCHRVQQLLNGRVSYSLWLRGPKTHEIELRGDGWPIALVDHIVDEFDEFYEQEADPIEEAMMNCHQFVGKDGYIYCGAVGSEDCDFECPFNHELGAKVRVEP